MLHGAHHVLDRPCSTVTYLLCRALGPSRARPHLSLIHHGDPITHLWPDHHDPRQRLAVVRFVALGDVRGVVGTNQQVVRSQDRNRRHRDRRRGRWRWCHGRRRGRWSRRERSDGFVPAAIAQRSSTNSIWVVSRTPLPPCSLRMCAPTSASSSKLTGTVWPPIGTP